ncbi:probable mediator of RNA polymerase ii transcription subunit 26c [Phtheirospermum japonicum]|uniref:Probable mediator of RNA polymerase ii transcription subunit 26c n=1 Tax=Phtheirospermum japonicum TaxID=374723 RepID=A0A830C3P4_9LAMI|nr:probable mediator of RNA polymerase ii transcription subunit 26c [Phtheirospermum japonicum]
MDSDEFRAILSRSRVGIWAMIGAAIRVASSDHGEEFYRRRDRIVESLYAPAAQLCPNCSGGVNDDSLDHRLYHNINNNNISCDDDVEKDDIHDGNKKFNVVDDDDDDKINRNLDEDLSKSPLTPESNHPNVSGGEGEEDVDPYRGLLDDEQTTIISIKEQLEDPNQSEDDVVELLQHLADMDITFQALKETDIGRHVNRLRKHPSNEVRRLVKQLVRKWKETVDEWVKVNQPQATSNLIADVDSPQQNIPIYQQNGHHQVPDFEYSPNPKAGSSSAERNHAEHETKPKQRQSTRTTLRPLQSAPKSAAAPPPSVHASLISIECTLSLLCVFVRRAQWEPAMDDERLNSARRRLQENYQEANNDPDCLILVNMCVS